MIKINEVDMIIVDTVRVFVDMVSYKWCNTK